MVILYLSAKLVFFLDICKKKLYFCRWNKKKHVHIRRLAAIVGANLVLVCDILCNLGTYPLPISTMSALFGAPIMIWIIIKK